MVFQCLISQQVVTKKSESEIKQHTNRLHDPKRSWFSDLLHLDEIFDLLPDTSLLVLPNVQSTIKMYKFFTHTNQQNRLHSIHRLPLTFAEMLTSTSFSVADYKHCPRAQVFFTTKMFITNQAPTEV
jgi:hypothetical protein